MFSLPIDHHGVEDIGRGGNVARAQEVAETIRDLLEHDPGAVKLHKLLYYCQAWHATWTGQELFPETIEAWQMGPVVVALWREEKYGTPTFPQLSQEPPERPTLSEVERRTVRYVVSRYGHRWGTQLIGETHAESPWRDAWEKGQNTMITLDSMREFFRRDPAADQAWFWDEDWQEGEREADRDIREGRTTGAMTEDEFLASL